MPGLLGHMNDPPSYTCGAAFAEVDTPTATNATRARRNRLDLTIARYTNTFDRCLAAIAVTSPEWHQSKVNERRVGC